MGVIPTWILCILFNILVTYTGSTPVGEHPQSLHVLPFIAKRNDGSAVCEANEAFQWTYSFHDCFINRKYGDGGRDLNSIVDRILDHGEACVELSSKECRPDFQGFIFLLNKTISQMKDYAEMYLEAIYKGRENIKDLGCVETVMNIKTYEECFYDVLSRDDNLSEEHFQRIVKKGILCANRKNKGCSKEAKTVLNRIVRIILGVEQPNEEEFEDEVKTTTAQPTEKEFEYEMTSTEAQPTEKEFEYEDRPEEPPASVEKFQPEVKPTEAPMMWYDYLAWPFVQAWKWISGLFG